MDHPSRFTRGTEVELTIKSRHSTYRCQERSLDRGRLRRTSRHSQTNGASPLGLRWPPALESDLRYRLPLISTPCTSTRINPIKPVFQRTNGSPDQIHITQMLITDLSTDHQTWPVPPVGGWVTPRGCSLARNPTRQTFALIKVNPGSLLSARTSQPPSSQPLNTKTVISSAYAKKDSAQGRTCLLIPKQGFQSEDIEKKGLGASERSPFTCTTAS